MCEQYSSHSGPEYAKMLDARLPQALDLSSNPYNKKIVQNKDPSGAFEAAQRIKENPGAELVSIHPKKPQLNSIENLRHLHGRALVENTNIYHKNILKHLKNFEPESVT